MDNQPAEMRGVKGQESDATPEGNWAERGAGGAGQDI